MNILKTTQKNEDTAAPAAGSTVLRVDSSGRYEGSVSRQLTTTLTDRIMEELPSSTLIVRDLAHGIPQLNSDWIGANVTPSVDRSEAQKGALALSNELVSEIKQADIIVFGVALYNFTVPASFKAYIDQVARAGLTFQHGENGSQGLLTGKRAIVILTTGGVPAGSPVDFASPYLHHILGFIGISDVEIIAADRLVSNAEASIAAAHEAVKAVRIDAHV